MNRLRMLASLMLMGALFMAACAPAAAPAPQAAPTVDATPAATQEAPDEEISDEDPEAVEEDATGETESDDAEDDDAAAEVTEAEFTEIDTGDYDFTDAPHYKKCAIVMARTAMAGEEVETVVDGLLETVNVANDGDYVVRNPGGEEYIVEQARFESRYTLIEETEDQYLPTGAPVQVIELDENVQFVAPWGETQYILAGGFLIFNVDEVYGIQRQEFLDTYAPANADGEFVDAEGNPIATLDVVCPANQP